MRYLLLHDGVATPVRRAGRITQEELQRAVGGPIETLPIPGETGPRRRLLLVVSALGPVSGAGINFWLRTFTTPVFGDALVVVAEWTGGELDFAPLSPADLERVELEGLGPMGSRLVVRPGGGA